MPLSFAYHRSLAPMLWVFFGLASVELFVVHLLVSIWSPRTAFVLSALTVLTMLWLIRLIRSFRRLPVLVDEEGMLLRTGTLMAIRLEWPNIEEARTGFASEALKAKSVLNLAMLSYPNVLIHLHAPVAHRRGRLVSKVAHCLDDPAGFAAAVARMRTSCPES